MRLSVRQRKSTRTRAGRLMTKHIMIDIETYATTADAAIVSIGACTFELGDGGTVAAGEETFIVGIDPDFYDDNPRFFLDPKTEAWWKTQSKEARDSLKINQQQTLPLALDLMNEWFEEAGFDRDANPFVNSAQRVWANPASFDLVILRNGAKHAYGSTEDVPWHYRQETCCRTHSWLFANERKDAFRNRKVLLGGLEPHRADHDAIRQARIVQYIEAAR